MTLIFNQKKLIDAKSAAIQTPTNVASKEIRTKILKNYLNIIALIILSKQDRLTGYDILKKIQQKQGIRLSVNDIYRVLHSLESDQLIASRQDENAKTVYSLTTNGKLILDSVRESRKDIELFMSKLFDFSAY